MVNNSTQLQTQDDTCKHTNLCRGGCGKPMAEGHKCTACATAAVEAWLLRKERKERLLRRLTSKKPAPVPAEQIEMRF